MDEEAQNSSTVARSEKSSYTEAKERKQHFLFTMNTLNAKSFQTRNIRDSPPPFLKKDTVP